MIIRWTYSETPFAGSAHNNAKKRDKKERTKKKRIEAESETIHPNPGNLCAHRGLRTDGKRKKKGKERNGEWTPPPSNARPYS